MNLAPHTIRNHVGHLSAIHNIPPTPDRRSVTGAILYMYYRALRQSEVVPPSPKGFDPMRHLTRPDVKLMPESVTINIKAAMNMQKIQPKSQRPKSTDYRECVAGEPHHYRSNAFITFGGPEGPDSQNLDMFKKKNYQNRTILS